MPSHAADKGGGGPLKHGPTASPPSHHHHHRHSSGSDATDIVSPSGRTGGSGRRASHVADGHRRRAGEGSLKTTDRVARTAAVAATPAAPGRGRAAGGSWTSSQGMVEGGNGELAGELGGARPRPGLTSSQDSAGAPSRGSLEKNPPSPSAIHPSSIHLSPPLTHTRPARPLSLSSHFL